MEAAQCGDLRKRELFLHGKQLLRFFHAQDADLLRDGAAVELLGEFIELGFADAEAPNKIKVKRTVFYIFSFLLSLQYLQKLKKEVFLRRTSSKKAISAIPGSSSR